MKIIFFASDHKQQLIYEAKCYSSFKVSFFIDFFSKTANGFYIILAPKYSGAGYKYVHTGVCDCGDRFFVDATIDFNQGVQVSALNNLTQISYFIESVRDEFLSAEAGINTHDQHVVNVL